MAAVIQKLITIDGPAGCGKSTVTRRIADDYDGLAFGTGFIYRSVTWLGLARGIDLRNAQEVLRLLAEEPLQIVEQDRALWVRVSGQVLRDGLHTPEVTREIHWVADDPGIRAALLPVQRSLESDRVVVAEGRDLGTVVYPDAPVKIFLTASVEERARRRLGDWQDAAGEHDLASVMREIEERDRLDRERDTAPLRAAPDAKTVDTTGLSIDQVVEVVKKGIPEEWQGTPPPAGSTSS